MSRAGISQKIKGVTSGTLFLCNDKNVSNISDCISIPLKYIIIKKIFLTENECKTRVGCLTFIFYLYIHFLSKIFFMIKWT